jgi:WD40 repeat protein
VEVRRDGTRSLTATLAPGTGEASPALAFALGVEQLSRIPYTDDFEIAAFSPKATILAVNGETNSVRLYDVASGRALRRLGEKGEYWVSFVSALSFSADGRLLASNGWLPDKYIGEINIWDVERGLLRRTIRGVPKVSALALSPDGRLLAAGVSPNTIKLWSVADGRLLWSVNPAGGDSREVSPLFFSPDGRMLISGHEGGGEIKVYDALTAEHRRTLPGRRATLAKDGRLSTYLFEEGVAVRRTWRSLEGELIESKKVKYRATGPMSELIVAESSELWNARTEQLMVRLPGSYVIALSADGRRLLMNGDESGGGFAVWSLPEIPENAVH